MNAKQLCSFFSFRKGPKVCILAGVHGNETDGIRAIHELKKNLTIERGTVTFIVVNQKAIQKKVRFIDENLNRCFKRGYESKTYEYRIAQELKPILSEYDICLDLHNSNTPQSEPFIICEKNAFSYVKYLPIQKIVSGFDTYEPGGTDYYMNLIGKIGICIECGSVQNDGVLFAKKIITQFLSITGNLPQKKYPVFDQEYYSLIECCVPKGPFSIAKEFRDFEQVQTNQIIGVDIDKEMKAKKESYILFARSIPQKNILCQEAFLLAQKSNTKKSSTHHRFK